MTQFDLEQENMQSMQNEKANEGSFDQGIVEEATVNLQNIEQQEQDVILKLQGEINKLKDLYLRAQAENQNLQRRTFEEVKKAREYSISGFAKEIVAVRDSLEMAMGDQSGNFDTLKVGVDLTLKQLSQALEKHHIKEIVPSKHDKLDPNLHQAMNVIEEDGQLANTIVTVLQKGYILNGRVLRPALVTIAK